MSTPNTGVTTAAADLVQPIKLSFPVINVITPESSRAEIIVREAAKLASKSFHKMGVTNPPNPKLIETEISRARDEAKKANKQFNGLVIFDPYFNDRTRLNPENIPALKASLINLESEGVSYIIASKEPFSEEFVHSHELPNMGHDEIIALIDECCSFLKKGPDHFSNEEKLELANNARGVPYFQIKNIFTLCAYHKIYGEEYLSKVRAEKAVVLRDYGLEVMQPIGMDQVGGLENVKEFLKQRRAGWNKDLPVKGIILAGVPGGGKTLIAKAVASSLGIALIRLDIGAFYDKNLGATDRQFSRALKIIESIAPVAVLVDEMEKIMSGGSDGDHEVSRRLLGRFLSWLQDRPNKIFIVATTNNISRLPPELIRTGRWDRSFSVNLPNDQEREKILEIHLRKFGIKTDPLKSSVLVACTQGFTGAEIEQSIIDSMYLAASRDVEPDTALITEVLKQVSPASRANIFNKEYFDALSAYGFVPASNSHSAPEVQEGRLIHP